MLLREKDVAPTGSSMVEQMHFKEAFDWKLVIFAFLSISSAFIYLALFHKYGNVTFQY